MCGNRVETIGDGSFVGIYARKTENHTAMFCAIAKTYSLLKTSYENNNNLISADCNQGVAGCCCKPKV